MSPLLVMMLTQAAMVAAYFSLVYLWIYPDSYNHLQNPRDWALSGAMLTFVFNCVGFIIWVILYLDGRKRGPGFSLVHSKPIFQGQDIRSRYHLIL